MNQPFDDITVDAKPWDIWIYKGRSFWLHPSGDWNELSSHWVTPENSPPDATMPEHVGSARPCTDDEWNRYAN